MRSTPKPGKLSSSVGGLVCVAVISAELVLAGYGLQKSTGGSDTIFEFVVLAMLAGSILYLPLVLLWFLAANILTSSHGTNGWRRFTVILLPQIVCGEVVACNLAATPPSSHSFFLRKIGIPLPLDADVIRVRGHLLVLSLIHI